MKTLKTSWDGKSNQPTPNWIEVKVSYLIKAYFRRVIFCNFVIMGFKYILS